MADYGWGWKSYVTVAERRRKAVREMEKRKKQGHAVSPVVIEGRTIAKTFWGKSWCDNLELEKMSVAAVGWGLTSRELTSMVLIYRTLRVSAATPRYGPKTLGNNYPDTPWEALKLW